MSVRTGVIARFPTPLRPARGSRYDVESFSQPHGERMSDHYNDEVYARRVPAGKRTYFFDVKTTRSGEDFFLTITESKRVGEDSYEKHKLYLYKEDFGKFVEALHEAIDHIRDERLPEYDFSDVPRVRDVPAEQAGGE